MDGATMSSSEDQLCINITSCSTSTSWEAKAAKRKFPPSEERRRHSKKVRPQEAAPPARPQVRRGADAPAAIKTSSLFKHNPEIPKVHRPKVRQLTEKIFTSESFSDLNLHPHLVATLNKVFNVSTLTSVQKRSIPALLSGRDAIVRSQTGSGKTLAFAVPLVQTLQGLQTKVQRSDGPLALVIVPTRELAQQTFATFQKLLKPFTWIVPGVLMGGEKRKSEKARLRKGINILVSTPGRLVDHIKHTLSITFGAVRWLVLDEADRTLDLGFEKDLSVIFNSLNSSSPERQNVLLSATLTQGVTRLADICLKDPISIQPCEPASPDPSVAPAASDPAPAALGQSESFALPVGLRHFVVLVPSKVRLVCLATFLLHTCKLRGGGLPAPPVVRRAGGRRPGPAGLPASPRQHASGGALGGVPQVLVCRLWSSAVHGRGRSRAAPASGHVDHPVHAPTQCGRVRAPRGAHGPHRPGGQQPHLPHARRVGLCGRAGRRQRQPGRDEADRHPGTPDGGRHLQGAGQVPQPDERRRFGAGEARARHRPADAL
ncbi:ATP-dependent DNA helicase DDX31 isoform X2 [Vanacampus margaritifer]